MADANGSIEVVIDDEADKKNDKNAKNDAGAAAAADAKSGDDGDKGSPTLEETIVELKKQLDDKEKQNEASERRRVDAETRANESLKTAERAETDVHKTNLQLIDNAIGSLKQQQDIQKSNLAAAMANSDYNAAADMQVAISDTAAKLNQLEIGKKALEEKPPAKVQRPAPISDPVEALASQLSPRSAAWVRSHPQCATNPSMFRKMLAAHNLAQEDGIEPDSDAYFDFVEQTLRLKPAETAEPESVLSQASQAVHKRASPAAAPVTRSGNGTGSVNGRQTAQLTRDEVEIAKNMDMSPQEYAKNKLLLIKEGKLH